FFFHGATPHRSLPSFPTRRSSDLHKVGARLMSQMGLLPWARRLVSNIQQHLDEDTFVKITGTKARQWGLDPYERHILRVTPEDIQGQFDFPVHTGEIPPDPGRNVEVW